MPYADYQISLIVNRLTFSVCVLHIGCIFIWSFTFIPDNSGLYLQYY